MKQFGSVRRLALDTKQNVECSGTGWRNIWVRVYRLCFHYGQYEGIGPRREQIRAVSGTEFLAGQRTIAAQEVLGRGPLLTFQLQFKQFDCCTPAAANNKSIALCLQFR